MRRRSLVAAAAVSGVALVAGCGVGAPDLPGRIAFVKGSELYLWSAGATRKLVGGMALADPAWSSDGSRLAAIVLGTNQSDLVVFDANGASPRQLTRDFSSVSVADSIWARKPTWSPDGTHLAFISDRGKHDMSLWLIAAGGGQPEPAILAQPYSTGLDWPAWAPSGKEIAFTTFVQGPAQIHAYDVRSRQTRVLVKDPDGSFDPAWSPDGKRLAFVARSGANDDVYLLTLATGDRVKLTAGGLNRAPAWSPRGDALAFVSTSEESFDLFAVQLPLGAGGGPSDPVRLTRGAGVAAESGVTWTRGT